MKYICPMLVVEDIKKSKAFYMDVLGMKVKYDFGENVSFEGDFAIQDKAYFETILQKPVLKGSHDCELYFEEDDVMGFYEKLKDLSIPLVHVPEEQPWRQLTVRFYDPDHFVVEVGESMEYLCFRLYKEGLDLKEISRLSNMPLEFVKVSIESYD